MFLFFCQLTHRSSRARLNSVNRPCRSTSVGDLPSRMKDFFILCSASDPTRVRRSPMPILLLAIIVAVLALSGYRETSAAELTALKLETQAFKVD